MHWLIVASLLAASPDPSSASEGTEQKPQDAKSAGTQPTPEEKRKLEEEIAKELGAKPGASVPSGPGAQPAPAQPQTGQGQTGGNPFARLLALPDISAIGRAALAWNQLDVETLSPRSDPFAPAHKVQPSLEEVELAFQAVVDPYARADVFLSFSPEGAEVEEAYLTTLQLPYGLQARGGLFFAPIGRLNQQHAHVFDFVDCPLALARLLGADALKGPGLDVAWLAPTPWFAELRVAYQALTPGFLAESRNAGVARLAQFFDVGDASTLGVGILGGDPRRAGRGSLARSPRRRRLSQVPPDPDALVPGVAGRGRLAASRASDRRVGCRGGRAARVGRGGYAQAVWRDGPYFAYGARYERAPAVEGGPEHRVSAVASWLPSEFQRIRLQVSYDRLPGGRDGVEALLHLEFAIGAHGAHPF